ncbi:neutral/alkaline non-lysosomal ceramidase N-terminal domain-containing protein [Terrarubrum flagellatum]|uniref:neutral/alkaline non-lysosomal ceramidase N-terminal domain-containing protein n=1 Tax=Terrirubrum flagellatum TaxID=2895980 RepID=UPI0031453D6E
MRVGAAIIDVTPPAGLAMAGFAARAKPAQGAHDALTVRAIAVDDTAIVCADVIGLHEGSCERIRAQASLDADRIIVAALHTHGGPACMPGRIGGRVDEDYITQLETACVAAIDRAVANQKPARILFGLGADPDIARNRRHAGGLVDAHLPVMRFEAEDGARIAIVTAYACHPVVLGADNLLWTADYPGFVRQQLEAAHPGAVVVFLTGCAADANTGHSAHASISLAANPDRTFEAAARTASRIAGSVLSAPLVITHGATAVASRAIELGLARREMETQQALAAQWRGEFEIADSARRALLAEWIAWAETRTDEPLHPWPARVTVMTWGGKRIVALPGEIFAETAISIRARLNDPDTIVIGFCDGCPGYIAPASEFPHGGYEIDEAHRYYGMPATFAPGAAEKLADAAVELAAELEERATAARSYP